MYTGLYYFCYIYVLSYIVYLFLSFSFWVTDMGKYSLPMSLLFCLACWDLCFILFFTLVLFLLKLKWTRLSLEHGYHVLSMTLLENILEEIMITILYSLVALNNFLFKHIMYHNWQKMFTFVLSQFAFLFYILCSSFSCNYVFNVHRTECLCRKFGRLINLVIIVIKCVTIRWLHN